MARRTTPAVVTTVVTVITDPVIDAESRRVVGSMDGCQRLEGSPIADGTPISSRSVFELSCADLAAGGLDDRIDRLHAYGINVHRVLGDRPAVRRTAFGTLGQPTNVIRDAHRRHLEVHGWTFRRENQFLPLDFRVGSDPNAVGDLVGEIDAYLGAGMDGFFTDNPDLGAIAAHG
jgi:glycerophosphoryl diester phosphodiesterase